MTLFFLEGMFFFDAPLFDAPLFDAPFVDAIAVDAPFMDAILVDAMLVDAIAVGELHIDAPLKSRKPPLPGRCLTSDAFIMRYRDSFLPSENRTQAHLILKDLVFARQAKDLLM